jgi:hypothetical protein
MVGSIVLPIMMTTGVPRTIAATLFLMSFALGFIFNIGNWTFYTTTFGVAREQLFHYAIVLAILDALALVVYAVVAFGRERGYATWAVRATESVPAPRVPVIALLTPFLPLVLYYTLKIEAAPAFLISALFGALVTRPRDAVGTLVAAAIRGLEDVAPAVLLFMGIGMLVVATKQPQVVAALAPLTKGGWMANPIAYVAVFGLASPLTLYRGPLNPFGVGSAIFLVLLASNVVPPVILVAAIMAVVQVQNVCDPTNTANVWVANFTGVAIDTITKRTLPFQVAVATAATLVVTLAAPSLFGTRAFASAIAPARADAPAEAPGFYAPPQARDRIAVADDGTPLGRVAAGAIVEALAPAGWHAFLSSPGAPDATDCSKKNYAALVRVATSNFVLVEGTDFDVGLRLEDCGGWIVDEWHDHRVVTPPPSPQDARALALDGVARLRAVDGNMRVYVRGGGPAFVAGLRSGDVVEKLDGQYWWQYGTYQTQARAFDGRPHTLEIQRDGKTIDVTLEEPFHA